MTEKERRVPVSVRAVIQRINRRLKKDGLLLKTCRGNRWYSKIGHYYLVSIKSGRLVETEIDLEKLARREHALELWEELNTKGDA